jgi:hypothetical protein
MPNPPRIKLVLIAGLSALMVATLILAATRLAGAPRLGASRAWDHPRGAWTVASARPDSPLHGGDELRRIGRVPIGDLEGLTDTNLLASRAELDAWLAAKRAQVLNDNACLLEDNARQQQAARERENRPLAERESRARDLHDGLGGTAARIALLAEGARRPDAAEPAEDTLSTIAELARQRLDAARAWPPSGIAHPARLADLGAPPSVARVPPSPAASPRSVTADATSVIGSGGGRRAKRKGRRGRPRRPPVCGRLASRRRRP